MNHLPLTATDEELIRFADQWAALMEREEYDRALAFTSHIPAMKWTASLLKSVIKGYDRGDPNQRVTLEGKPTEISQKKEVSRWAKNRFGQVAEIWYDLNINGFASDLTATFRVFENKDGLEIKLNDIHVM